MKFKDLSLDMPTDYSDPQLRAAIAKRLRLDGFTHAILKKSLDARKKNQIHWQLNVRVFSDSLPGETYVPEPLYSVTYRKRDRQVVVIGSGPAGMFAALLLQKAGFAVTILERGADVQAREQRIARFEKTGIFDASANYAFGEGGAGTFSDGKLTSRSKHISREKAFILDAYVRAGAPPEIQYLAHPHLGSDNLRHIVRNLREEFKRDGGRIEFETLATDLTLRDGRVGAVQTPGAEFAADYLIVACGHSAYETYRMLMRHGVGFRVKSYALGSRVEHRQELINTAQWGRPVLPGVKAAEYRLTARVDGGLPVYSFCMCPGGTVVPAAACAEANIVNGMSLYARDGRFANAACVAGVNLEVLLGRSLSPEAALAWTEDLEHSFHRDGYRAPACTIRDFLAKSASPTAPPGSGTSYPLGLEAAAVWEMLPPAVSESMRQGLRVFARQLKGFDDGLLLGLESKTSAPIQVLRGEGRACEGFPNLFVCGEGSGFAGGIISSATDGILAAAEINASC